jgi:hypothetical protein
MNSRVEEEETGTMLHCDTAYFEAMRAFASPAHCSNCGDLMIAPLVSEFVEGGEIRHHWACEVCGQPSSSSIPLCGDE